ncbi:MAG: OmpA family protein [Deltaproteobacteria bacterium]|nr:MAG: OmpA family protein [Deltaproteobacteria bacterium]
MRIDSLKSFFILCAIFLSWSVLASDTGLTGINGQTLRPPVDGNGLIGLEGSQALGGFYSGFFLDYARRPLSIVNPSRSNTVTDLSADRVMGSFQSAMRLTPFLSVGLNVPVLFYQGGTRCDTFNCSVLSSYSGSALGDVRLDLKFQILERIEDRLGVAVVFRNAFPTGSQKNFVGGGGEGSYETRLVLDKSFGHFYFVANTGYRTVNQTQVLGTLFDDEWTYGLGLSLSLPHDLKVMAEAEGSTGIDDFSVSHSPIEVRAGVSKKVKNHYTVSISTGTKLINAFGAPDARVALSVGANFGSSGKKGKVWAPKALVGTVYFRFDEFMFQPRHLKTLKSIADSWRRTHSKKAKSTSSIVISAGYADAMGDSHYNEGLAQKRADVVKQTLVKMGIPADEIHTESYGDHEARRVRRDFKDYWKDRRVDIYEEVK